MELVLSQKGKNTSVIKEFQKLLEVRSDLSAIIVKKKIADDVIYYLTTDRYYYEIPNYSLVEHVRFIFQKYKGTDTIERRVRVLLDKDMQESEAF